MNRMDFNMDDGTYIADIVTDAVFEEEYRLPDFRYEEIKKEVASFFKKLGRITAPIEIFAAMSCLGIRPVEYSFISEAEWEKLTALGIDRDSDGFLVIAEKDGVRTAFIYYNDAKSPEKIRFTIMHEIAHFFLGHTQPSLNAEAEANFFAKYAVAPPPIIHLKPPESFVAIHRRFGITNECASFVFGYYQKWLRIYMRRGMSHTEYEHTILELFAAGRTADSF